MGIEFGQVFATTEAFWSVPFSPRPRAEGVPAGLGSVIKGLKCAAKTLWEEAKPVCGFSGCLARVLLHALLAAQRMWGKGRGPLAFVGAKAMSYFAVTAQDFHHSLLNFV